MNQTQQTVLTLVGSALFGHPPTIAPETDWQAVWHEMQLHSIANIGVDILPQLPGIDESLTQSWSYSTIGSIKRFYRILLEQSELISLLNSAGIQAVVMKGAAAAMYYPNPDYRAMGDIDLLVEKGKVDSAVQLMSGKGYATCSKSSCKRHESMRRHGVEFELHRFFTSKEDGEAARHLNSRLLDAIPHAEEHRLQGFTFPTLPPLENGLVLLEHLHHHIAEGIGLRHVLDWAMYVSHVLTDDFWHASFRAQAQRVGLEKLAIVTTRMAQLYLGLPEEEHTWCMDADGKVCSLLLEYVLSCGNFGVKHGQTKQVKRIWSDFGSIREMFSKLQKDGCSNFRRQIARFPFLKPFAWLMRIFRLIFLSIKQGIGVKDIQRSYDESRQRIALFKQLGVRGDSTREH